MFDTILLMIYMGGIIAVFRLAKDEKKQISIVIAALLWPVVVSAILVENFLGMKAPKRLAEWLFKKAK